VQLSASATSGHASRRTSSIAAGSTGQSMRAIPAARGAYLRRRGGAPREAIVRYGTDWR